MSTPLFLLLFLYGSLISCTQANPAPTTNKIEEVATPKEIDEAQELQNALQEGQRMVQAFQEKDYDTYTKLVHIRVVALSGGQEAFKKMIKEGLPPDLDILEVTLENASPLFVEGKIYQCILGQKQVMQIKEQKMYTLGSMIAISYNAGRDWTFISVNKNSLESLQEIVPALHNELPIMQQTIPVLMD